MNKRVNWAFNDLDKKIYALAFPLPLNRVSVRRNECPALVIIIIFIAICTV